MWKRSRLFCWIWNISILCLLRCQLIKPVIQQSQLTLSNTKNIKHKSKEKCGLHNWLPFKFSKQSALNALAQWTPTQNRLLHTIFRIHLVFAIWTSISIRVSTVPHYNNVLFSTKLWTRTTKFVFTSRSRDNVNPCSRLQCGGKAARRPATPDGTNEVHCSVSLCHQFVVSSSPWNTPPYSSNNHIHYSYL